MCLIPRMQVPVMMGKSGKIIDKIRTITKTYITVNGPYNKYRYQNIEIFGEKVENVAKACFFLYRTVWKALKR